MTLLADTKISSFAKPADGVGMQVRCHWQVQLLNDLCWNQVLLTTAIDNEMKRRPLDPHLRVKEAFPFLEFFWFTWLDFGVVKMALGSASIICFPLSRFDLNSESSSNSEAFSSAMSDCIEQHSSVLCQGILWYSHHFPMSFFNFSLPILCCGLECLS